ncbi:MAG: DNA repair protein RecO [Hirschia sp.]|nr:DNA repair protein RecO [Hirschia sp.]MBF17105.1 DNA repair protein RecO [Hirschia sp.]
MAEWTDSGIVIGVRRFGETDVILDALTPERGRVRGLVYGGISRKKRAALEPGNTLRLEWRARSADNLGHFAVAEPEIERASRMMADPLALSGLAAVCDILREALSESEAKPGLYEATEVLLSSFGDADIWPAIFIRWELGLLSLTGYGLNLDRCAVTGGNDGLTHVSPRTGRAVRGSEAEDYLHKLLVLPGFLTDSSAPATPDAVGHGFRLTGYFLKRRLFAEMNKDAPEARYMMLERLERAGRLVAAGG